MAIKKREQVRPADNIEARVERFAAAADGGSDEKLIDPSAIRDFKAIRVPFNQFEYEQLEQASKIAGRSKLNFIRYAMLKVAREIMEEV